ncbi:hypothetical protein [Candidatus Nitrososphaera sp. FF02]
MAVDASMASTPAFSVSAYRTSSAAVMPAISTRPAGRATGGLPGL